MIRSVFDADQAILPPADTPYDADSPVLDAPIINLDRLTVTLLQQQDPSINSDALAKTKDTYDIDQIEKIIYDDPQSTAQLSTLSAYLADWYSLQGLEKFIIVLTLLFMLTCGISIAGYIVEQLGNSTEAGLAAFAGFVVNANAQKSIFLEPLMDLARFCQEGFFVDDKGEKLQGIYVLFFGLTLFSTAASFAVNIGLSYFGAKVALGLMLGVVGASPMGPLVIGLSLFFGFMNALLVLSGTLSEVKSSQAENAGTNAQTIIASFFKHWTARSVLAVFFSVAGIVMTFMPGVATIAQGDFTKTVSKNLQIFSTQAIALTILGIALITEGWYALTKARHAADERTQHIPDKQHAWDKFCAVTNALVMGFVGAEGGREAAEAFGIKADEDKGETLSNAGAKITQALEIFGAFVAAFTSYCYTLANPDSKQESADEATRRRITTQYARATAPSADAPTASAGFTTAPNPMSA